MTEIEKLLPHYYKNSHYMQSLCVINNKEFDRLYAGMNRFDKNMLIDTADEEGVKQREKSLGIIVTNETLDIRKKRIKAKMRGTQPTTVANLKSIVESYNVSVDIIENIEDYSFAIIFHQPEVPEDTIREIVEELKPAHLAANYSFMYYGSFEMSDKEYEYAPDAGFADGSRGGYLGNIGSEEENI